MLEIRFSTTATRSYRKLARSDRRLVQRVNAALDRLAREPQLGKPLVGPLAGLRSHRVGSLRVIYRVDMEAGTLMILELAQRGAAYR